MSFLTGSHVYGNPHPRSDIDLVVRLEEEEYELLCGNESYDGPRSSFDGVDGWESMRFGRLNLLVCITDEAFELWSKATSSAKAARAFKGRKLSRMESVDIFESIFNPKSH